MVEFDSLGAAGGGRAEIVEPRVTVLIDTYNYGHFIEQAIESVLSQDFPLDSVEILVVDDGSTDGTAQRIRKYQKKIQYHYKPNGGQASAFNFGFAIARGEIVALLDADDYWFPSKLRRIVDEFQKNPELGMVYHRLLELNTETNETAESLFVALAGYLPDKPSEFIRYFPYPTSCVAFRRRVLQQVLPVPEKLRVQADGYLGGTMVFAAQVLGIPDCLAAYRIHGQNLYHGAEATLTRERRQGRIEARQVLIDGIQVWLAANGYDRSQATVRDYLGRWFLYQENDRFILEPPSRLRFFRHLLAYNYCYRLQTTRRLKIINQVKAFGSLIVGYEKFYLLDRWGQKAGRIIRRFLKRRSMQTETQISDVSDKSPNSDKRDNK